jgi:NADPH:quinone reductase-like Zn-dependent oxidoreductase
VVFPLPIETPDILEHLRSRLESGAFWPIIDRTYRLEDIVEAHRYVESGQEVGKVVIDVRTD